MKQVITLWLLMLSFSSVVFSQSVNIKSLEKRREELRKGIEKDEAVLKTTTQHVNNQLFDIRKIENTIKKRESYLTVINKDLHTIDSELNRLNFQLNRLEKELREKKERYKLSVIYLYKNRTTQERMLFVLSADNLNQIYRRLRYVEEYANFQLLQGAEIKTKQSEILKKTTEIQNTKGAKKNLLQEEEHHKELLKIEQSKQKIELTTLQKREKELKVEVAKKQRLNSQLEAQINNIIDRELDRMKKIEQEKEKKSASKNRNKGGGKPEKSASKPQFKLSKDDEKLSSNFVNNKGKLPVPVTLAYTFVSSFGKQRDPEGKNLYVDNKGLVIQTKSGADARSIFDGVVIGTFPNNGLLSVMVRHGDYFSIYSNLTNVYVKMGEKVSTRQPLGKIYSSANNNNQTLFEFHLRKDKVVLNPSLWLSN